jgi:hypothetical protein
LFQKNCVVPVLEDGETEEGVRTIRDIIYDSAVIGLTLRMKNSEKAQVMWERVA